MIACDIIVAELSSSKLRQQLSGCELSLAGGSC